MSALSRRSRYLERQLNVGLKAGQFVSWPASSGVAKGRVVSVHTGKVPGVVTAVTATESKPAARVQLYAKSGDGWEPTSVHFAHGIDGLTMVEALPEPSSAATEAVAVSFDDIRGNVQDAINDRLEAATGVQCHVYVYDLGMDWAVYSLEYDDDLMMVAYSIDSVGAFTLGDPVSVCKVTTYVADTTDPATETTSERIEGRLLGSLGSSADGGRIFEVQIIAYGDSKNGRRYPETVMRESAALYEGAKAYDHHRTEAELNTGTVVGIVGDYRNVTATGTGLSAELHLLPSATHTAELLDRTLANQTLGLPPLVGISHDAMTQWKPITVNGRQFREVTAIHSVNSADVVADPAAGGIAMRMVANLGDPNHKETIDVTYKQLLALLRAAEAAKRPALLSEHTQLIESFGFTVPEFTREVEATAPSVAPVADRTVEAVRHNKASLASTGIITAAMAAVKLDARFNESVVAELPEQFTEAELVATVARFQRAAEAATMVPTVQDTTGSGTSNVAVRFDTFDKKVAALDAMFAGNWQEGYKSLKTAFLDITGYKGTDVFDSDFNRTILQESAQVGGQFYDSTRSTESVTSSTWGLILGDSITRHMVAEYSREDWMVWKQLVNTYPLNDFRTQRVDRLGDYAVLPTVNQGAPYQPLTTPSNEEATYVPAKRGGTEDLTLETIANDDIRTIIRIPQRLGIAAAETIFKFVLDFFIAPITATYDSVATFHASHSNTDANTLNDTNLSAGWTKMLKQSALSGTASFLPVNPKFLLAPPDLRQMALVLCQSAVAVPAGIAAASNIPNVNQGLIPIIVPYWTATSTTAWFLASDPSRTPGIEIGLYQGKEDPDLFVQSDQTIGSMFDADKLTYKIRHIYGGTVVDHRGLYRGNS